MILTLLPYFSSIYNLIKITLDSAILYMNKHIGISFIYKYINLHFIKQQYSKNLLIIIGMFQLVNRVVFRESFFRTDKERVKQKAAGI